MKTKKYTILGLERINDKESVVYALGIGDKLATMKKLFDSLKQQHTKKQFTSMSLLENGVSLKDHTF